MNTLKPLFVDLDGTLIQEDLSHLAFFYFLKNNPLKCIYHLLLFLFFGRPYLKEKISKKYTVNLAELKINQNCIQYIKKAKNEHRGIYLISGSHRLLVNQVKDQLKLFNEVFGTHDDFNMVGKNKIKFINKKLKIFDFDYIGNSKQDLPIWAYNKKIIYTNISKTLEKKIQKLNLEKIQIKEYFI